MHGKSGFSVQELIELISRVADCTVAVAACPFCRRWYPLDAFCGGIRHVETVLGGFEVDAGGRVWFWQMESYAARVLYTEIGHAAPEKENAYTHFTRVLNPVSTSVEGSLPVLRADAEQVVLTLPPSFHAKAPHSFAAYVDGVWETLRTLFPEREVLRKTAASNLSRTGEALYRLVEQTRAEAQSATKQQLPRSDRAENHAAYAVALAVERGDNALAVLCPRCLTWDLDTEFSLVAAEVSYDVVTFDPEGNPGEDDPESTCDAIVADHRTCGAASLIYDGTAEDHHPYDPYYLGTYLAAAVVWNGKLSVHVPKNLEVYERYAHGSADLLVRDAVSRFVNRIRKLCSTTDLVSAL